MGFAFENQVTVERVVQSGNVDGSQSVPVATLARMRRLSNPGEGNRMCVPAWHRLTKNSGYQSTSITCKKASLFC